MDAGAKFSIFINEDVRTKITNQNHGKDTLYSTLSNLIDKILDREFRVMAAAFIQDRTNQG